MYIKHGYSLLPQGVALSDIASAASRLTFEKLPEWDLEGTAYGAVIGKVNLKSVNADRMVKKTTERQSQWVVYAAAKTGQEQHIDPEDGARTGLYISLGAVDCDEEEEYEYINAKEKFQALSEYQLNNSKPLTGLILLNTTATSHVSQMFNITGSNCCFAPMQDGGSNAFIEAIYDMEEGRIDKALCGGGSQKVSPWYFLSNEDYWNRYDEINLTEAASFFVLDKSPKDAEAQVIYHHRRNLPNGLSLSPVMDKVYTALDVHDVELNEVMVVGGLPQREAITALIKECWSTITPKFTEDLVGFAGAASVPLCINLSLLDLKKANEEQEGKSKGCLVLVFGTENQFSCFVLSGVKNEHE